MSSKIQRQIIASFIVLLFNLPVLAQNKLSDEIIICSISAAVKYEIPANVFLAIAEKEAGKPGQWVLNSNGTHDVGYMQFNTGYLRDLTNYGITANDVAAAGCYSFDLAAWRIRQHIKKDKGDLWTKVANYHSRTYLYNSRYRADLMTKSIKWANWLESRFETTDIKKFVPIASVQPTMKSERTISINTTQYIPRKLVINGQ